MGREGQGYQAWNTYRFGERNAVEFGYRHARVSSDFLPRGGTLNDASVRVAWWARGGMSFGNFLQWERWKFPLLASQAQTNWTSAMELAFWPRAWKWQ